MKLVLLKTRRPLGMCSSTLRLTITIGACLLPGSWGEHDHRGYHCEKLCLLCSELPDYSGCDNCNCGSGPKPEWDGNGNNAATWIVLMFGILIFILFCKLCSHFSCRWGDEGRLPSTQRIIAQPVGPPYQHHDHHQRAYVIPSRSPTTSANVTNTNSHNMSNSTPNPAPNRYITIPGPPYIIPLGGSSQPQPSYNDLDLPPPEYFPPPSYNECVGVGGARRGSRTKY